MEENNMDINEVIKKARGYAKQIKKENVDNSVKIGVLGSCSIQYFVMILRYELYMEGICSNIYEGEFNGIAMDILDSNSAMYHFAPEILIILPDYRDITRYPELLDSKEDVRICSQNIISYYKNLWKHASDIPHCHILLGNFVIPIVSELGNMEVNYTFSKRNFIRQINDGLVLEKPINVTIVDLDYLASYIGKREWFDFSAYFLYKLPYKLDFTPETVKLFASQIKALKGILKKCLVLDLDNTLWGGVIGDDGLEGVQLDPNHAVGESFLFFQDYLLGLKKRGVILAVCSKNEESTAKEPFLKHKNMRLRLEDFSCFIANWNDKASNIKKIAQTLHIGTDSLVFFDDNPAEREIVKQYLPEVCVIDVPKDPALYVTVLEETRPFEWLQITKEDISRNDSYTKDKERKNMEQSFVNYEEYLSALQMEAQIGLLKDSQVERYSQLINKSNQFNLRTCRYSESAVEQLRQDGNLKCIYIQLKDKFTDYGIISCVILKKLSNQCFIDTWLMSCRVLKRDVELFAFSHILKTAKDWGCNAILGEYVPTTKNSMVKDFYPTLGFEMYSKNKTDIRNDDNSSFYIYKPLSPINKKYFIKECAKSHGREQQCK